MVANKMQAAEAAVVRKKKLRRIMKGKGGSKTLKKV